MTKIKESRKAIRTHRGWAISILQEAHVIRDCEYHGWAQDRASLRQHLLSAHTAVGEVGKVAEAAGVAKFVLSHIVPGNASDSQLSPAQNGFSGELIIGRDLMTVHIGSVSKRKG